MKNGLHTSDEEHLRQAIVSRCTWSEPYTSIKHILNDTSNRLPLLVSFFGDYNEQNVSNENYNQTIFFFDRNISKKTLFTPLRQLDDKPDQFEVYPRHCTFAITDSFKGILK